MRRAAWRGVVGAAAIGVLASVAACDDPPAGNPEDELLACAAPQNCLPTAWFFDHVTSEGGPAFFSEANQVCAFQEFAAPPATMDFGRAEYRDGGAGGEKLLIARWADGSSSCVVITVTGDEDEPSTAYDCELPDSFFEQCAAQAEQGTFERECVDWYMWPFERFEETNEVRCGPLE